MIAMIEQHAIRTPLLHFAPGLEIRRSQPRPKTVTGIDEQAVFCTLIRRFKIEPQLPAAFFVSGPDALVWGRPLDGDIRRAPPSKISLDSRICYAPCNPATSDPDRIPDGIPNRSFFSRRDFRTVEFSVRGYAICRLNFNRRVMRFLMPCGPRISRDRWIFSHIFQQIWTTKMKCEISLSALNSQNFIIERQNLLDRYFRKDVTVTRLHNFEYHFYHEMER